MKIEQMNCDLKIRTYPLCLGFQKKKDIVKINILEAKIDICCMQKTEIEANYLNELMSFGGCKIEIEKNTVK